MKKIINKKKRRDIIVGIRFNHYEYVRLEKACRWVGRTISDFGRRAILRRMKDTRPSESAEPSEPKNRPSPQ